LPTSNPYLLKTPLEKPSRQVEFRSRVLSSKVPLRSSYFVLSAAVLVIVLVVFVFAFESRKIGDE